MQKLGLTRVAFACQSLADIPARQARFTVGEGESAHVLLSSARIPRRDLSGGSLFWILKHTLVARQPILSVAETAGPEGTIALIRLSPTIAPVVPRHYRAHQGWRYLAEPDWPADQTGSEPLPQELAAALAGLALL
ncbi:MAG: DUF1489 family protein [Sandaracinobacter sp.]